MMKDRKIYILITSVVFGLLFAIQSSTFSNANEEFLRDNQSNIFQEIKILRDKNEDLKNEVQDLESTFESLKDQNMALKTVEEEIEKYTKLTGSAPITGPGIEITISGVITTPWMIDLVNEFFNSGAEAVAINGIRIVNQSMGFDTLPQGQIFLNGSILTGPYTFTVIGESATLEAILKAPGGIFDRLKVALPEIKIETLQKEIIEMAAIL
ncbi:MAG: DUF881 domain-containing protein [Patescibacteria group bacterium]